MSTQKTFKRTGWTTEEVIKILQGIKIVDSNGDASSQFCTDHNDAIDDAICTFYDFIRPQEEFGAMAYCVEENMTYHIGTIPEEDRGPPRQHGCRVRPRPVAQPSPDGTEPVVVDAQAPSQ